MLMFHFIILYHHKAYKAAISHLWSVALTDMVREKKLFEKEKLIPAISIKFSTDMSRTIL